MLINLRGIVVGKRVDLNQKKCKYPESQCLAKKHNKTCPFTICDNKKWKRDIDDILPYYSESTGAKIKKRTNKSYCFAG